MGQCILTLQSSGQKLMDKCAEVSGLAYFIQQQFEGLEARKHQLNRVFSNQTLSFVGGQTLNVFRNYTDICRNANPQVKESQLKLHTST